MATRLQQAFAKSDIRRSLALFTLNDEYLPVKGYKRLFNEMFSTIMIKWPESEIKAFLLKALSCYDLPADTRAEAIRLLQLSETALTARQRRKIDNY